MQASGGPRNSAPGTLTKLFFDAVEKFKRPDALQFKVDGKYQPISHLDLADRVRRVALGLQELGIRAGERRRDSLREPPRVGDRRLCVPDARR